MMVTFSLSRAEIERAVVDFVEREKKIKISGGITGMPSFTFRIDPNNKFSGVEISMVSTQIISALKTENGEARQIDLS